MSHATTAAVRGTVHEAFVASASAHGSRDFLCVLPDTAARYGIDGGTHSYAHAARETEALRQRYAAVGLGHGHRVALMLENRPAFFFHWLALNALGVSVVPVNTEWRSAELEYLLAHSEVVAAVVPGSRADDLRRAAHDVGRSVEVTAPDLAQLDRVLVAAPFASRAVDIDSECALLYTSGTTGKPKGCVLPNEYFLRAGSWYASVGGLCAINLAAERLITPLPMSHMNAMACSTMVMMLTGGCIVPLDRFHPASWWDDVRKSRATIIHYLGVMPAMLLGAAADARDRDHSVRFGFGAGVSPRLHAAFEARFGFPLLEAWAMTETGAGAVVIANREPRKVGTACFGRADASIEFRVVDDAGVPAAAGQPGELLVRAAGAKPRSGFFREYLKDAAATADVWDGGYFHTGDVVQVDADGDFHFVDRKKNVIRRSGENISAVEVESVLLQHPHIAGAGVTAVPDAVRGDEVMACIVPREPVGAVEQAQLARDVVAFCLQRLAYFKAPGYITFIEQLPLTPTEKIQRARLKELAQAQLNTPGCLDLRVLKKRTSTA
jgi:acyl-CoA synthetase (AMP-forming)/AMP-acid ligase II